MGARNFNFAPKFLQNGIFWGPNFVCLENHFSNNNFFRRAKITGGTQLSPLLPLSLPPCYEPTIRLWAWVSWVVTLKCVDWVLADQKVQQLHDRIHHHSPGGAFIASSPLSPHPKWRLGERRVIISRSHCPDCVWTQVRSGGSDSQYSVT